MDWTTLKLYHPVISHRIRIWRWFRTPTFMLFSEKDVFWWRARFKVPSGEGEIFWNDDNLFPTIMLSIHGSIVATIKCFHIHGLHFLAIHGADRTSISWLVLVYIVFGSLFLLGPVETRLSLSTFLESGDGALPQKCRRDLLIGWITPFTSKTSSEYSSYSDPQTVVLDENCLANSAGVMGPSPRLRTSASSFFSLSFVTQWLMRS